MSNRITIVSFGAADEALALRFLMETMNQDVRLLRVTSADKAAAALIEASEDDVIIISATGGRRGFFIGPSSKGDDWVQLKAVFEGVHLRDGTVLISTAAEARESGLVDVMFHAGGRLIAPNGAPDRGVVVPWVGACLLGAHAGLAEAVIGANKLVEPEDRFTYG